MIKGAEVRILRMFLFIDLMCNRLHVTISPIIWGGFRFRKAFNESYVNGIRFVDYKNYKPKETITPIEELDMAFESNGLTEVSEIKLENIKVSPQ